MGKNSIAKRNKSAYDQQKLKACAAYLEKYGYKVMTPSMLEELKSEMAEFVMKRAYVVSMSSFIDNARTFWKGFFKSRKKMEEFLGLAVDNVELMGKWIEEDKILHFDDVAEWIYENYGKDFRTEWMKSHKRQEELEELAKKQHVQSALLKLRGIREIGGNGL